jgi:hypothetical protein
MTDQETTHRRAQALQEVLAEAMRQGAREGTLIDSPAVLIQAWKEPTGVLRARAQFRDGQVLMADAFLPLEWR